MGVAGAVAGTFGIQPLVGAFGVPYQAAEPKDERQIRLVAQIAAKCHRVAESRRCIAWGARCTCPMLSPSCL